MRGGGKESKVEVKELLTGRGEGLKERENRGWRCNGEKIRCLGERTALLYLFISFSFFSVFFLSHSLPSFNRSFIMFDFSYTSTPCNPFMSSPSYLFFPHLPLFLFLSSYLSFLSLNTLFVHSAIIQFSLFLFPISSFPCINLFFSFIL